MTDSKPMPAQVALVTGASRGIGRAIALTLAGQGMTVIGTATTEPGAASINAALAAWPACRGACLDVNDGAGVEALIERIVKDSGGWFVALFFLFCAAMAFHELWPQLVEGKRRYNPAALLERFPGPVRLRVPKRKLIFFFLAPSPLAQALSGRRLTPMPVLSKKPSCGSPRSQSRLRCPSSP